jgi:hypothetical protein
MPVVQVEANLSLDQLVRAVEQLSKPDLDFFVPRVIALRAQRQTPTLSQTEADLLLKINEGLPALMRQRYADLIARRQAETLTDAEYAELLELTQQVEACQARRVACLAELAQLRKVPLTTLADSLGINEPNLV